MKITYLSNNEKTIFKPVIRTKEDLVLISKIAFDKQPLEIKIYYKDDVIVSEKIKGEDIVKRVYKLSKNETGDYKIVINTNNRTYIKDFKI